MVTATSLVYIMWLYFSGNWKTWKLFFLLYCLPFQESTTEPWAGYKFRMSSALSFARKLYKIGCPSSIQSIPSMMCASHAHVGCL